MTDDLVERKRWTHAGESCLLWTRPDGQWRACAVRGSRGVACVELANEFTEDQVVDALAAAIDSVQRPRTPWFLDREPIVDVLVVGMPSSLRHDEVFRPERPIALSDDLRVVRMETESARILMDACDPEAQHRLGALAIDLRMPMYALVRNEPPREGNNLYWWDSDRLIQQTVALSRLVRPTSIGFSYAVKQIGRLEGRHRFATADMMQAGTLAWTAYPERDWMDEDDFRQVARLLKAFQSSPPEPGSSVQRAMWLLEYAARTYYVDLRWTLVAGALDQLLVTNPMETTWQFTRRIRIAADMLGLPAISAKDASKIWGYRGKTAHGELLGDLTPEKLGLYRAMEGVAQGLVRRAIEDLEFRQKLTTDAAVNAAFAIEAKPPKEVACPACQHQFALPT